MPMRLILTTLSINILHYDQLFHYNYNLCIDELHEESLKQAHEENAELPLKEIEYGVKKARVKLDLDTVVNHFIFGKSLQKKRIFRYLQCCAYYLSIISFGMLQSMDMMQILHKLKNSRLMFRIIIQERKLQIE